MLGPTAVANPIVTLLRWHMSTLAILLGVGFRSPQASVNLTDRIMCVTARPDYANPAKITVKAVRPQVVASWQVKTAIVLSIRRWSGSSRPIDFGRTVNPPPRGWRKLHLGVDADTHEVVAVELTRDDVGDVSELAGLLDQVATRVASVMADGAYDGETVYNAVTDRHPDADIVVPPRATAVPSTIGATQRDQHIATVEKHGRIGWQRRSGYNRRSLVETAMYRYETIIGRRPYARNLFGQQIEAKRSDAMR